MKKPLICLASIGLLANVVVWPAMALAQKPPGYGSNATLHPYTSHLGPRASGGDFWSDGPQPHFQEPPGYDNNPVMHPYSSGITPCPQGTGYTVCTEAIPPSR
jgi:hypothetical protein